MLLLRYRLNYSHGFYFLLLLLCILMLRDLSPVNEHHEHDSDAAAPSVTPELNPPGDDATPRESPMPAALRRKHLRIMAVGDSVTAGALGTNSYREKLIQLLHHNEIEMVGNVGWGTMKPNRLNFCEAHMAQSLWEIAPKLPPSIQKHRPNVILFHVGTNDVAWKKDVDTLPQRTEAIIDSILEEAPDAALLVAQIIPCAFRIAEVKEFNRQLLEIVTTRRQAGSQIMSVDMFSAFEYPGHPNYLADISHPNAEGYWVMAKEWQSAMEEANALGWINQPQQVSIADGAGSD